MYFSAGLELISSLPPTNGTFCLVWKHDKRHIQFLSINLAFYLSLPLLTALLTALPLCRPVLNYCSQLLIFGSITKYIQIHSVFAFIRNGKSQISAWFLTFKLNIRHTSHSRWIYISYSEKIVENHILYRTHNAHTKFCICTNIFLQILFASKTYC